MPIHTITPFNNKVLNKVNKIVAVIMQAARAQNFLTPNNISDYLGKCHKHFGLQHFGKEYIDFFYGAAIGKLALEKDYAAINFLQAKSKHLNAATCGVAFVGNFDYLDELYKINEIVSDYVTTGAALGKHWKQVNTFLLADRYVNLDTLAEAAIRSNSFNSFEEAVCAFSQLENNEVCTQLAAKMQPLHNFGFSLTSAAYRAEKLRIARFKYDFTFEQAYAWSSPNFRVKFYTLLQNKTLPLDMTHQVLAHLSGNLTIRDIQIIHTQLANQSRNEFITLAPMTYYQQCCRLFQPYLTQLVDQSKHLMNTFSC